jgi:hypothetical protein
MEVVMRHARSIAMLSSVLALGLACGAKAQTAPAKTPPPASASDTLSGVTVDSARRDPLRNIPPEKRAKFDAEVAKRNRAKNYRASRPQLSVDSKGIADNNAMSNDFPGLHTYIPPAPGSN